MIRLTVKGMTCGHCEQAVRRALASVAGVSRVVDVSREQGEARVEGHPDVRALIAAVREQGYEAELAPR